MRLLTLGCVVAGIILFAECNIASAGVVKGTMFNLPDVQRNVDPIDKGEIIEIRIQDFDTKNNIKPLDETGKEFPEYGIDFRISVKGPRFSFTLPKVGNSKKRQVVDIQFFRSGFFEGATARLSTQILQAVVVDDADNEILTFNVSVPRANEMEKMQPSKPSPAPTLLYPCQPVPIVYPEWPCCQPAPRRCGLLRR